MLKFIILLLAFQAVSANRPEWRALKEKCASVLTAYDINSNSLKYSTYVARCAAIEALNNQVSWDAEVNCLALLDEDQISHFTQLTMPDVGGVQIEVGATDDTWAEGMVGADDAPEEYNHADQGQMTPARNQGGCGSCWAFAALSQLENTYIKYTGQWYTEVDFSEQQLVDCTYEHPWGYSWQGDNYDSCKGGWMNDAWQSVYQYEQNKISSESDYGYVSQDNTCSANSTDKGNAFAKIKFVPMTSTSNKVFRWYSDMSSTTKTNADGTSYQVVGESTAHFIARNFSVSIAVMAESAFQSYKKGIFNTASVSTSINHAVTLYGYTQDYFELQNSWGTWWGVEGCMKITRRQGNLIQMMKYMMYPRVECSLGTNAAGYCKNSDGSEGCMCYNGGLCKSDGTCLCKTGWEGDDCQAKDEDECRCLNGGTCVAEGCKCTADWQGEYCQTEDTCGCINGKCDTTTGTCDCKEGWGGESGKCDESDEQGCGCKNGGVCNIKGGCDCPDGFSGDKCEKEEKECSKKCKFPKVCYWKTEDMMKCRCPEGTYGGRQCVNKADCTTGDARVCAKLKQKKEDKFWAKCEKPWGVKKCPHSCGFCED